MKKTGLYFGSFNPVHVGHLIVAEYLATQTDLEEVWLVISPQNPLKTNVDLAPEDQRLAMLNLALQGNEKIKASDIEFSMPRPSYTCDTLRLLSMKYPERLFTVILGEDNKSSFSKWKNFEWILQNYSLRFFPRHDAHEDEQVNWNQYDAHTVDAPRIELSSTAIRKNIRAGKSIRYQVTSEVANYIEHNGLYRL